MKEEKLKKVGLTPVLEKSRNTAARSKSKKLINNDIEEYKTMPTPRKDKQSLEVLGSGEYLAVSEKGLKLEV